MSEIIFEETREYEFGSFISEHKLYIPKFQRYYVWSKEKIKRLFEDIVQSGGNYFIGNVVLVAAQESTQNRLMVVDGQQRLVTLSLFLIAIRGYYFKLINDNSDKIEPPKKQIFEDHISDLSDYLFKKQIAKSEKDIVLSLNKDSLNNTYRKLVEGNIVIDKQFIRKLDKNQKYLINNYNFICDLIKNHELCDKEPIDIAAMLVGVRFVSITCKDDNGAFKIYEGLNSTNMGLYVSDLVKNAVLWRATNFPGIKTQIENTWDRFEQLFVDRKSDVGLMPTFLRHQWISTEDYISMNSLFTAIKREKLSSSITQAGITRYIDNLYDDAKTYLAFKFEEYLQLPGEKLSKHQKELISRFRFLGVNQVYEVLLALYRRKNQDEDYEDKYFTKDLRNLWFFVLRAKIMRINPSKYEKVFSKFCKALNNPDRNINDICDEYYNTLNTQVGNDEEFVINFSKNIYTSDKNIKTKDFVSYILKSIIKIDNKNIQIADETIEHIIPQNTKKWKLKLLDIKKFVHNIGNLTLLSKGDNGICSDETMDFKVKEVYSKSQVIMNKELVNWKDIFITTPEDAVAKRSEYLAKKAATIFRIDLLNKSK